MITDLRPYPAMKDSLVKWLGEVPEHWEVHQLGRIGRFSKGNGGTKEDEVADGVPCVRYGDLYTQHRFFVRNSQTCVTEEKAAEYTPIQHGDVLFAGSGETIEEIGKSAVNLISGPACCGGDVILFRPSIEVNANFLGYATDCPQAAYQKSCMGRGITVMHIYGDELKYMYVGLPPVPEQAAIVRYLDHVDRRVQRFVRAKQKLIGLLEEQKQAIIHRAVTRGLDPDVPLKDSGVEWLGEVPAHWEVVLLGRGLTGIGQGWSPVAAEGGLSPDQWAVLTLSSVRKGRFNPSAVKPIFKSATIPDGIEVKDGDLLLTRSNTRERVGDVCIVQGARPKTVICDLIYRLTPESRLFDSSFLMCQLLSSIGRRQIERDARGSSGTMPKISQRHIRSWRMLAPPLDEQRRISGFVEAEGTRIDAAIDHARREIELLREYRTRLIADVVTGKLDVRDAATCLPEEPDESEALHESNRLGNAKGQPELVEESAR